MPAASLNLPACGDEMHGRTPFERYRVLVEAELRASLDSARLPFYDMHRYHLGWVDESGLRVVSQSGKLLRSTLCLAGCRAAGGDPKKAAAAAAAVELVHNFSLVHDDIQDASEYRRHRTAVWKVWGTAQAINVGDSMHALAHLVLMRLGLSGMPERKVVHAGEVLAKACMSLCEGQYLDILYEGRTEVTLQDYLDMVSLKTGALLGAAAELGALVGTDDEMVVSGLRVFGTELGIAFQIHDDILGIWGDSKRTGKPLYDDIRGHKKTLPVVYALRECGGEVREALSGLYRQEAVSVEDAARVAQLLQRVSAREYAEKMVERHRGEAIGQLKVAPVAEGRDELTEIAQSVLGND
ncbi:MAG: polyprenyl synthetase family protein [Chloroflexota bacterium]